jgi:septal ring factor EnvC (AmiA/AmiB activator)
MDEYRPNPDPETTESGPKSTSVQGSRLRPAMLLVGIGMVLLLTAGCGDEAPEKRLSETRHDLLEVREKIESLEANVSRKRETVERAEDALSEARERLARAESDLSRVRARLDARATRVALFRAVQSALLEREALEDYAIRVEVADDQLILRGEVDEQAAADRALEVARAVVGADPDGVAIVEVESRIQVRPAGADSSERQSS